MRMGVLGAFVVTETLVEGGFLDEMVLGWQVMANIHSDSCRLYVSICLYSLLSRYISSSHLSFNLPSLP